MKKTMTAPRPHKRMRYYRHPYNRKWCVTTNVMNYSKAKFWILLTLYVFNSASCEIILRIDPLALLSATLRTYQKAACDTDQILIACPRGTSISIEFAQYNKFTAKDGITIDELCPTTAGTITQPQMRTRAKHLLRGSIFGSTQQKVPPNRYLNSGYGLVQPTIVTGTGGSSSSVITTEVNAVATLNAPTLSDPIADNGHSSMDDDNKSPDNCMWPNALQYSLLQTVVEACQKKKHCKFSGSSQYNVLGASGVGDSSGTSSYHSSTVSSNAVGMDPCPKRKKIIEVAYKCRPYEFRSKVACHNDVAQLECNPYARIAVYSASFGRTEYESIQCPQPQGVREETCLASYATETVMQICHGRRRCNLAADANTFGSPCQPNSRMYLKVVYTCVPKQVLKDRYESDIEGDEIEDFEGDLNDLYVDELSYKESEAVPKLYSNTTVPATKNSRNTSSASADAINVNNSLLVETNADGVNPVMTHSADLSLDDDEERLYLYLLIAGSVTIVFSIVVIAVRLLLQKPNSHSSDSQSGSSLKVVGMGDAETAVPNGFNDTISEIDADIDLTTPIPLPSVSQHENYIAYGPSPNVYGSVVPSNVSSHSSSTILLQRDVGLSGGFVSRPPTALLCSGPTQSPDIIDISSGAFVSTSNSSANILAPAIVFSSGVVGTRQNVASTNSSIGAAFPVTSLAQYTIAPTFRSGYIMSPDGTLQRPVGTATPPILIQSGTPTLNYSGQQEQVPIDAHNVTSQSTLRRSKPVMGNASATILGQQPTYDGTAPRTLSTGLPGNSQFYYG